MALSLPDLIALTVQSLRRNLVRSSLTTLGMFMGVAAVTATMNVRTISQATIAAELAERSAPQVVMGLSWTPKREQIELRAEEIEFLRPRLPGLRAIAAVAWVGGNSVVFEANEANPSMFAVSKDFPDADGYSLKAGRFFTDADYEQFRPVAILDQFLTDRLFQDQDPIGRWVYIDGRPFAVVGIVPTQKTTDEPQGVLIIPLAIHSAVTGRRSISSIQVRPYDLRNLEELGKLAKDLLKQRQPGRQLWDFNNSEDVLAKQKTLDLAAQALTVVAVISLLIGGVGIANVMIGSVIERTPEIGLRRAIGATKQDVMLQFVLEAATLSVVGGIVALITVHGATLVISQQFKLPYEFDWNAGAIALGSALVVGIGAGLPSALRASQLDPVKALQAQ